MLFSSALQDNDNDFSGILALISNLSWYLNIRDIKHRGKTYKNCFYGMPLGCPPLFSFPLLRLLGLTHFPLLCVSDLSLSAGYEFVDSMMEVLELDDREDVIDIGQMLLDRCVIYNVTYSDSFSDSKALYRLYVVRLFLFFFERS